MKKIILFSHNPQRDANFDAMLANELGKTNMVWVRKFLGGDYNAITTIKPHVIILPEIRCEYTVDLAKQCKQYNIAVVVRACEVGITKASIPTISEDYKSAIFGNWDVNDHIDLFIGWGPKMCELFNRYGKIDKKKIFSAGSVGFDQYLHPIAGIAKSEKPIMLFATGFPYADRNPQYSLPEAKAGDPIHSDMVSKCLATRSKWLAMIREVINHFGDKYEYRLRVHGGEREIVYQTVLKDLPITYTSRNQALVDMASCDILIHAGSTMAYEAYLLNKPAFNYYNMSADIKLSFISPKANSIDLLIYNIEHTPLGVSNADKAIVQWAEENYYGKPDGQSHIRAADRINQLPKNPHNVPDKWPKHTEPKYAGEDILLDVERWICNACMNHFFVTSQREMIKCPYCGIACVKLQGAKNVS